MQDLHTFIKVRLSQDTALYTFIFDTGAGETVIDKTAAMALGLNFTVKKSVEGAGGNSDLAAAFDKSVHFNSLLLNHVNFYLSELPVQNGVQLNGIIGYDLLKDFACYINYEKSRLEIYAPNAKISLKNGKEQDFKLVENIPVFPLRFTTDEGNQLTGDFFFDTGAGLGVSINAPYVQTNSLTAAFKKKVRTESTGVGTSFSQYSLTFPKIEFAGFQLKEVPANLSLAESGATARKVPDGILGNDVIHRFNVLLNYKARRAMLSPNQFFNSMFKYDYTGLVIKFKTGGFIITKIIESSPAANAGLQAGDKILSVNDTQYSDLKALRQILNDPGTTLTLKIERDQKEQIVVLRPAKFY
jgi:predicted aspartyl protease